MDPRMIAGNLDNAEIADAKPASHCKIRVDRNFAATLSCGSPTSEDYRQMNRDFEFKQLLRAFRGGIISESTFEAEMAKLEGTAPASNGDAGGFHAFGKTYKNERAAIVSFLDKVRAGEANGGEAFAAWAAVCTTDCIKTGIRMIAEREAYHSRVFAKRLAELGGQPRAENTEDGRKFTAYLGDPNIADNVKLLKFV